jgi:hypothetical protein
MVAPELDITKVFDVPLPTAKILAPDPELAGLELKYAAVFELDCAVSDIKSGLIIILELDNIFVEKTVEELTIVLTVEFPNVIFAVSTTTFDPTLIFVVNIGLVTLAKYAGNCPPKLVALLDVNVATFAANVEFN